MSVQYDKPASANLLALVLLLSFFGHAGATEFRCETENTSVVAEAARDATLACKGAAAAIDFLRAEGLDVAVNVRIQIVPALPREDSCEAAGFFHAATNEAIVLSLAEFRKFGTWLRVPISDELYKGLVAHEVAHVIACKNFSVSRPSIQAQEYIAYVTTLATLGPELRALVLSEYPGDGYETEQQMNTTIYLCNPMRFGVEAYRHFIKKGGDARYFDAILAGRVLAE